MVARAVGPDDGNSAHGGALGLVTAGREQVAGADLRDTTPTPKHHYRALGVARYALPACCCGGGA